jgi:hypothetical protein
MGLVLMGLVSIGEVPVINAIAKRWVVGLVASRCPYINPATVFS